MNREIKFRGKRIDTGEWVYGGYYSYIQFDVYLANHVTTHLIVTPVGAHYKVDPETVGEWSGLRDKNEKDIYEHDLVRFDPNYGAVYVEPIEWHGNGWWLIDSHGNTHLPNEEYREVIGNTTDNPGLVGGEEDK